MEKEIVFNYGDSEQFMDYNPGDKFDFKFPNGAIFFVGSNEGMIFCNKINIFKEEVPNQVHTKISLYNDENLLGFFFVDAEKKINIILSSDDTVFRGVFIYSVY